MEKLLMAQALDERDFLAKKIKNDINNFTAISVKRKKDPTLANGKTVEVFEQDVRSKYQSIRDNISRYERLCAAITQSNATTMIKVGDEEISVAKAITIKKEISNDNYFIATLIYNMKSEYAEATTRSKILYESAARVEENFKNSLLTSKVDGAKKSLSEDEIKAVETMAANEYPEIIDPLNLEDLVKRHSEALDKYVKELETAIKISNATTFVEF
jgi:hypothetical protein